MEVHKHIIQCEFKIQFYLDKTKPISLPAQFISHGCLGSVKRRVQIKHAAHLNTVWANTADPQFCNQELKRQCSGVT